MSQDNGLMVSTQALEKTYELGNIKVTVLKDINLRFHWQNSSVICGSFMIRKNHPPQHYKWN